MFNFGWYSIQPPTLSIYRTGGPAGGWGGYLTDMILDICQWSLLNTWLWILNKMDQIWGMQPLCPSYLMDYISEKNKQGDWAYGTSSRGVSKKQHAEFTGVRDCRQITFVMLSRFCSLSKKSPPPLFLTDTIKMDGILTKINWKIHHFTLYLKFWIQNFRGTSYNNL